MKNLVRFLNIIYLLNNRFLGKYVSGLTLYECYDDATALYTDMTEYYDVPKTYHVCPNTTFTIGELVNGVYVDGGPPITIVNNATKVLCGPEGNVNDNCVIRGQHGFEILNGNTYHSINTRVLVDLLIQGFTFTGGTNSSPKTSIWTFFLFLDEVDLTVKDCKFLDQKVASNIYTATFASPKMERITIEDCHFKNQEIYDTYLVGGYYEPEIIIRRSSFVNNTFVTDSPRSMLIDAPDQINDPSGSIMSNSSISIEDSCFEMNANMGFTLALSTNVDDKGILQNNYQAENTFREEKEVCYGVSISNETFFDSPPINKTCADEGFKATRCVLTPTKAPTTSSSSSPSLSILPTSKPSISAVPTINPTSAPSKMKSESPSFTKKDCYDDGLELYNSMQKYSESSTTFRVCSNTTLKIGEFNQGSYLNGVPPITICNNATKVICGNDGNINNNCTIVGGMYGVFMMNGFYCHQKQVPRLYGLLVQGFTFTSGGETTTSIGNVKWSLDHVDLTVKNCMFLDNPKIKSNIYLETETSVTNFPKQKITIEDCRFENQNVTGEFLVGGYNEPDIIIRRSSFVNNRFLMNNTRSMLIYANNGKLFDSSISIEDSCFEMNANMGFTLALSTNVDDKGILQNNYQAKNTFREEKEVCYGSSTSNETFFDSPPLKKTCAAEEFKATRCVLTPTFAPSVMKSVLPSSVPNSMPSNAPSMMSVSPAYRYETLGLKSFILLSVIYIHSIVVWYNF